MQVCREATIRAASGTEFSSLTCQQRRRTKLPPWGWGEMGMAHSSSKLNHLPAAGRCKALVSGRIRNLVCRLRRCRKRAAGSEAWFRQKPSPADGVHHGRLLSGRSFPPRIFPGRCRDAVSIERVGSSLEGETHRQQSGTHAESHLYLSLVS
jgi:hypothetical protein